MFRVHLVGLHKGEPVITKDFQHAEMRGGWLICWNIDEAGSAQDERWYPARGVVSVEVVR